ncbi:MAG: superoxide dismutase [Sarcina sp.]
MYKDIEAKAFKPNEIKGLTEKQVEEHLKLYKGYVAKVNDISKASKDSEAYSGSNPTFSAMRCLKVAETFALNGVVLHELYFENISCSNDCKSNPDSKMAKLIDEQYCGQKYFMDYLKQVALSVRGWAVVAIDKLTKRLRIIGIDAHDVGSLWCAVPLLVIDVYEHAYFMDFGTDRGKYLDTVFESINWSVVEERVINASKTFDALS